MWAKQLLYQWKIIILIIKITFLDKKEFVNLYKAIDAVF